MEMEDQSHTNQYGIDLRQFISGRPTASSSSHFPPLLPHQPPELFPGHRSLQAAVAAAQPPGHHHHHHYDLMMLMPRSGLHPHDFPGDSSTAPVVTSATLATHNTTTTTGHSMGVAAAAAAAAASPSPGMANALIGSSNGMVEGEGGCFGVGGGDIGGTGRWPRQETLTLLEIRSSLDSKFKEANQKGPLWEEVSRIMAEEHGYQRSGKKCREKFENLYKYYKKTKEGKAGRQDGKHYRFFRQLEALYGETSNGINPSSSAQELGHFVGFNQAINPSSSQVNTNIANPLEAFHSHSHDHHHKLNCDNISLSLSNSSGYDTTSEEEDQSTTTLGENDSVGERATRRKRRGTGRRWKAKVKEFLDAQMGKLMERQEAWLERLTCTLEEKEKERLRKEEEWRKREAERVDREHMFWAKEREWIEARDAALMEALQKLTGRDHHHHHHQHQVNASNSSPDGVIAIRAHHHHQEESREGGNGISTVKVINKRRKENSRSSGYFLGNESMYHTGGGGGGFSEINDGQCDNNSNNNNDNNGPSLGSSNAGNNVVSDSCFRFLMGGGNIEGENLWENYGLKLSKGEGGGGNHGSQ